MKRVMVIGLVGVMGMVLTGCAGLGGPSDAELIQGVLDGWKQGIEASDIDMIMAAYSKDFQNAEMDYDGIKEFISGAIDMGYLDGAEVSFEDMEVMIEGDKATVYPINLSGAAGGITLEMVLGKSEGGWAIVDSSNS